MSKNEAIELAQKVLKDVEYWSDDIESPIARYDKGEYLYIGVNTWSVGFGHLAEDFGRTINGRSRANIFVTINDDTNIAIDISSQGGTHILKYDLESKKYSIKSN